MAPAVLNGHKWRGHDGKGQNFYLIWRIISSEQVDSNSFQYSLDRFLFSS